ncbi:MAG: hypothetical protein RL236_1720 [Pseudomonadota bacterium]|jgi:hypothetical protein
MAIEYKKAQAVFTDFVDVEEVEMLLEWLLKNPKGKIHLANCTHIHSSSLQVLIAIKPAVVAQPNDVDLAAWLMVALK